MEAESAMKCATEHLIEVSGLSLHDRASCLVASLEPMRLRSTNDALEEEAFLSHVFKYLVLVVEDVDLEERGDGLVTDADAVSVFANRRRERRGAGEAVIVVVLCNSGFGKDGDFQKVARRFLDFEHMEQIRPKIRNIVWSVEVTNKG